MSDPMIDLTFLLSTLQQLDVAVPERTQRALTIANAVTAAVQRPSADIDLRGLVADRTRSSDDVVAALREAAIADSVRAGMQIHALDVQRAAAMEGRAGLADEQTRILAALGERFAQPWTLVVAAAKAGVRPGMSAEAVLSAGRDASAAWADLGPAETQLDSIRMYVGREAWRYIAEMPAGMALADVQQMLDLPQQRWLAVAAAGVSLRGNTDAQVKAVQTAESRRVERIAKQQQAERDAANAKHAKAWAAVLR